MITLAFAKQLLEDRAITSKLSQTTECGRGFYTLDEIYEDALKRMPEITSSLLRKILQDILVRGQGVKPPEVSPSNEHRALNAIYRTGVLQSELEVGTDDTVVYMFPTELHKRSVIEEDRWLSIDVNKLY